ncbi:MAG: excinuclease ABC subunit UvrC [Peptococcaceae bacterium]
MTLAEKLKFLPDRPGVYIFREAAGEIIYVGKAVSLKKRVRQYFQKDNHPVLSKAKYLVERVSDLEYIVTDNEIEALILEGNLIKKHRPRYNVNLKDDKSYPYLKITTPEDFPRVFITRRPAADGARYFGPYPQVEAVRETLSLLRHLIPFRTCQKKIISLTAVKKKSDNNNRPCLNYHIKRCPAPCCGKISREDYHGLIKEICLFMEGRHEDLRRALKKKMEAAAGKLEFEKAAVLRNKLQAIQRVTTKQKVASFSPEDQDIFALAAVGEQACVTMFFVRAGRLIGREHFFLKNTTGTGTNEAEIVTAVLKQYYHQASFIPGTILLSAAEKEELPGITAWLSQLKGQVVSLQVPNQGEKKKLVALAGENALLALEENVGAKTWIEKNKLSEVGGELARLLGLAIVPGRVECFDVSNIQGHDAVASMVVFEEGRPRPDLYRRFRIKTVTGSDDYACLREVIKRRFRGWKPEAGSWKSIPQPSTPNPQLPDLVIVDGGKGQLTAAKQAVQECNLAGLPVFALAKKEELLYVDGRQEPLELPRNSPAFFFLLHLRDEAHRFAVSYHRQLRNKNSLHSLLDEIEGVGPVRRKVLLKYFSSLTVSKQVSAEELAALPGMNRVVAEKVISIIKEVRNNE